MRLKSGTNWILAWYREILDKPDSLAIAGVHTTLIAVLVACLSAYVIFVYTTVQQAELKAIEEAEKINSIVFLVHQCPYRRVEQAEVFDREKLIDMMRKITLGLDDPLLPKDLNGKAEKALGIMGALVGQYPFPVWYFKTKEGGFGARDEGEPISFANLNEIRAWLDSMHETTGALTTEVVGLSGNLLTLLTEFGRTAYVSQQRDIIIKSPLLGPMVSRKLVTGFGWHVTLEGMDPVLVYHDFLNGMKESMSIVKSTQNYVKRADALGRGYPSKLRLRIVVFLVVVAFGCGVVYPLATVKVRRLLALWVPLVIYVLIGILAFGIIL